MFVILGEKRLIISVINSEYIFALSQTLDDIARGETGQYCKVRFVESFKLVFYQLQIFSCQTRRTAGRDDAAAVEYKTTNTLQRLQIQLKYS